MIFRLEKFLNSWFRQPALLIRNDSRLLQFPVYLSCEMLFVLCCRLCAWPHTSVTKNRRGTRCDDHRRQAACSYLQKPTSYSIYGRMNRVTKLLQGPDTSLNIVCFLPHISIFDLSYKIYFLWSRRIEVETPFLTIQTLNDDLSAPDGRKCI